MPATTIFPAAIRGVDICMDTDAQELPGYAVEHFAPSGAGCNGICADIYLAAECPADVGGAFRQYILELFATKKVK